MLFRSLGQRGPDRGSTGAGGRAHQHAGLQQGASLAAVHVAQAGLIKGLAGGRQVDGLAAGHAGVAGGARQQGAQAGLQGRRHAGMAGGQAIDLASTGKALDEACLRDIF